MKVLMLNYEYPPLGGGAANATHYLLQELAMQPDVEVDLLTASLGKARVEQLSEHIRIHFLDVGGLKNLNHQPLSKLLRFAWVSQRYAAQLVEQADLIHAFFGIPSGFTAMCLHKPFVVSLRGSDVPFYNKRFVWLDRLFFKYLSRLIWKKSSFTIANSEGLRQLALQTAASAQIGLIPNGVDVGFFRPSIEKKQRRNFTVISVGRLIPRKGFELLIEAAAGIPGLCLQIAGDGPNWDILMGIAQEKEVNLQLLGKLPPEGLRDALQKADLFALASYNEGMSNAALEALACGLPLVLTRVGGSDELIDGNGAIIPVGDVAALRQQFLRYIDHAGLCSRHGQKSRVLAMNMSWEQVAKQYIEHYNLILNRRKCVE